MNRQNSGSTVTASVRYQLVRARRKTIAIHVKPQGVVEVRAPLRASATEVERFVKSKEGWINKHLQRFESMPVFVEPQLCWGGAVQVMGEAWVLVKQGFGQGEGKEIPLKLAWDASPQQFQKTLDQWLAKFAQHWFEQRHAYWCGQMNALDLRPSQVNVRKMKRRWGSCRRNGTILFNTLLIKYPPVCIDCVVVHELCHLVHFNHSAAFYRLMAAVMPDWKAADDLLREHALRY